MKEQETLEGNKLIAEFQNDKIILEEDGICIISNSKMWFSGDKRLEQYQEKCYHSSWDWLMPVVEKIEKIHNDHHGYFGVYISSNQCTIQGTKLNLALKNPEYGFVYLSDTNAIFDTKIKSTWFAVVEFIKWYNLNIKNNKNERL